MKKVLILLSLVFVINLSTSIFQSCCRVGEYSVYYLDVISGSSKRIVSKEIKNGFDAYVVSDFTGGIRFDSVGIDVANEFEKVTFSEFSVGGFSSAMACEDPTLGTFEYIEKVSIVSDEDYNEDFPSGSDLGVIMQASEQYLVEGDSVVGSIFMDITNRPNLFYVFNSAPSETKKHNLSIKYLLDNGKEFETTITDVLIRNN